MFGRERSEVSAMLRIMPSLGLSPSLLERIEAAETMAASGVAKADNARQMVLNRDPRLTAVESEAASLAQVAATVQQTSAAADAVHTALAKRIDDIAQAVAALTNQQVTVKTKRVTTTVALALGASIDLIATWDAPFKDTNYVVIPLLDASGIANVQGPAYKSHTAAAAVVTVKANIAVAAGVAVNVIGLRVGA